MILVDSRVGSRELVAPLIALGLPVEETMLEAGDLLFAGRGTKGKPVSVGVEYKKLGDLIGSLRSGRLQDVQATGMQSYDYRWLLIEGELIYGKDGKLLQRKGRQTFTAMHGGMTMSELWKRLLVLQLTMGLTPLLVRQRRDTLKLIEALYRVWTDKSLDEHKSHLSMYVPPKIVPFTPMQRIAAQLPGIGFTKAKAVARHFGTPLAMAQASEDEWQQIEGIGRGLARQAVRILQTQ